MENNILSRFDFESHYYITESKERLNGLAKYLSIMNAQVTHLKQEQSQQLKEDLETTPDSWSESDQYNFVQWREGEYRQFESFFPESFRYSFIVLLWLVLEDELKRVCEEIQRRKKISLKPIDAQKGIFKQCLDLLDTVGELPREKIEHLPQISDLQKIRDCIVHTTGYIEKSRDKVYLKKIVDQGKYVGLEIEYGRLKVEFEYCELATQNTLAFFTEIFNSVGIKIWKESDNP